MEREFKWKIPQETLAELAAFLHQAEKRLSHDTLQMAAVYYDTPDDLVYRNGAALRIRKENDRSVCCMKRTVMKQGAQALREEYETEAATLSEGLAKLPDAGAPRDLCIMLSHQTFRELGRTEFIRNCYLLSIAEQAPFTAELAIDVGALGAPYHMCSFEELELEFKSGDTAAFLAYAEMLERTFSLIPQKASKLARAVAAANTLTLKTPAKINLSLDITGRLPNGYHTMRSVFQTVGIYDTLTLTKIPADQPMTLTCNIPDIPCDARNLVWKAAEKLLGENPHGLKIHLEKQIPSQAGMGGGSADCAAALMGIRRLLSLPVSDEELHAIAASLGADCAFFLYRGTCYAEGIGEKLTQFEAVPRYPVVIAKGNAGISTPEAYRRLDALAEKPPCNTDNVLHNLQNGAEALFAACGNWFDAVTDLPEVEQIRTIMRECGVKPVLSGSGAAVFGGCADRQTAEHCAAALRSAGIPFVAVTETVPPEKPV